MEAGNDMMVVVNMVLSNSAEKITYDVFNPGNSVETITNKDKMIFYSVDIGVINPTKKNYNVKIICVDSKDDVVYKGFAKRSLDINDGLIGKDQVKRFVQIFTLNPRSGAKVGGKLKPLMHNQDYYIKLYFEDKLVGITQFHYLIIK